MVRTGVLRAYGGDLRRRLSRSMSNRFSALLAGLGIAVLLQSSTATALMASSFASRGLVLTAPALAIMLGADVGTTLVVQIFSFDLSWLSPLLILIGVIAFNMARSTRTRDLGRVGIGVGLILMALQIIAATAEPMRQSAVLTMVLSALGGEPTIAILIAVLLTVLSTSSLAVVLLIISLVGSGVVSLPLAFTLVLGANLGGAVTPLIATIGAEPEARRVPFGNFLFRLTGVVVLLPFQSAIAPYFALLEPEAGRQVANFHTAFNLALALLFIWFIHPIGRMCTKIFPKRAVAEETARPRYLDPGALESPAVAIANAARETLRMGDIVEAMLRESLDVFRNDDRKLLREVESRDDDIDKLHEAIKLYLTEVSREAIDARDSKRLIDVVTFTTNLEHIGDIIDKSLMELAAKKIKNRLKFSAEGFQEICDMHTRLLDNLKLALNVFVAGEPRMARQLLEEKVAFRELERAASENHLTRLRKGRRESIETSSLHLDVLRDLKRINSHLTSVSYPILDAAGELTRSRLKSDVRQQAL